MFRRLGRIPARHKYGAVPTDIDGVRFHSKKEAERYRQLKILLTAGQIRNLELQKKYALVVNGEPIGHYWADFVYEEGGRLVVEDVKGFRTAEYRLKRKLMHALHGITIVET